jgi:hypothetical protein
MDDYWPIFTDFVKAEKAAGGPDAQLKLMCELTRMHNCDVCETVWMIGCYGAVHCVPTAFATWQEFRPQEIVQDNKRLHAWLIEHWAELPVRVEMRSARMPEKRLICLTDFANYALNYIQGMAYEQRWAHSQQNVKYYGRYMAIKVLEMLRMTVDPHLIAPDVRARGGWSPRRSMAMLLPWNEILDQDENRTPAATRAMEEGAIVVQAKLAELGVEVSLFQLQVLLCNFREALNGRFYDGGGHDEEMEFIALVSKKFPAVADALYAARKNIFDPVYLGEMSGWHGLREHKLTEWKMKGIAQFGRQHY